MNSYAFVSEVSLSSSPLSVKIKGQTGTETRPGHLNCDGIPQERGMQNLRLEFCRLLASISVFHFDAIFD